MTSSWLHSVSQLLALAALLAAFWIMLRVYRWHRRHMTKPSPYSKLIAEASDEKWNRRSTRIHTTISDHWPIMLLVVAGLSLGMNMWQLHREFHRQQYADLKNVRILEKLDDYRYRMDVEDPDTHQRNMFSIQFCPDWTPTHEMVAGVTLTRLKYEIYPEDRCVGIAKDSMGYTLLRDDQLNPILIKELVNASNSR